MLAVATVSVSSSWLRAWLVKKCRGEQITDIQIARVPERYCRKQEEDVRAPAEIASKKKHSPARKHVGASSIFLLAFVSGLAVALARTR